MCEIFLQGLSKTSEEPGYEPESSRTWGDANHSARKVPQCLQAELKFSGEKMNRGNPRKKSNHTEAPPPPIFIGSRKVLLLCWLRDMVIFLSHARKARGWHIETCHYRSTMHNNFLICLRSVAKCNDPVSLRFFQLPLPQEHTVV